MQTIIKISTVLLLLVANYFVWQKVFEQGNGGIAEKPASVEMPVIKANHYKLDSLNRATNISL